MKLINRRVLCPLILQLFLFIPFLVSAGTQVKKPPAKAKHPLILQTDTTAVKVRPFEPKKLKQFTNDKDFIYDKSNAPGISIWAQIRHWLWEHFFKNVFESSESNSFFYYLFVALGVVFVIFIIFKATGISAIQIIRGKAKTVAIPYTESLENIHDIDFDAEIDKALAGNNYRLAIRLLYLRSLKQLNDAGLINWQIEKTNGAYISEIPDGEKRRIFSLLTRQFEYVWYGNFYINANTFQNIRSLFQQLNQTK